MKNGKRAAQYRTVLECYEYFPDKHQNYVHEYIPQPYDYKSMRLAISTARLAIGRDTPIGAVGVHRQTGRTWASHSMDHITGDPRKHAEDDLLDKIFVSLKETDPAAILDIREIDIYSTNIPCGRCIQALCDCGATRITYGTTREEAELMANHEITAHDILVDVGKRITVVAGLLAVEAAELLVAENRAPRAGIFINKAIN